MAMEELIKAICEKTGISEGQAMQAVELVRTHLADKLPAPVAGQVEKLLGGEGEGGDGDGGLMGKVTGLLGKKD
jgi:hypothetical protein